MVAVENERVGISQTKIYQKTIILPGCCYAQVMTIRDLLSVRRRGQSLRNSTPCEDHRRNTPRPTPRITADFTPTHSKDLNYHPHLKNGWRFTFGSPATEEAYSYGNLGAWLGRQVNNLCKMCAVPSVWLIARSGAGWYDILCSPRSTEPDSPQDANCREFPPTREIFTCQVHFPKCSEHTYHSGQHLTDPGART